MVLIKMNKRFKTLPFAQRWCTDLSNNIDSALKRLSMIGALKHYPQLIEKQKGIVSQAEHTVIVKEDGCEVIT
jgi:methionyl aminopeptidase